MPSRYKDSLFRSLFSDEKTLRELYNALTGAALAGYAAFVAKVRALEKETRKAYPDLDWKAARSRAISGAITYCKSHDILKEYWETLSMEDENMLATEWNQEEALEVRWEEGREEGWNEAVVLMEQGYTPAQIRQKLTSSEQITSVSRSISPRD